MVWRKPPAASATWDSLTRRTTMPARGSTILGLVEDLGPTAIEPVPMNKGTQHASGHCRAYSVEGNQRRGGTCSGVRRSFGCCEAREHVCTRAVARKAPVPSPSSPNWQPLPQAMVLPSAKRTLCLSINDRVPQRATRMENDGDRCMAPIRHGIY